MTVSSELNRKQYTGNGVTTSFATSPVVFFDTSDLVVYVVTTATGASTTLTENTHYTVSGGDGSTGTVNLAGGSDPYGAPASTQTVVIVRDVPLTQASDFVQNDASDAEVVEDALDKLTMADQQLSARLDRSFTLADSDVSGASLTVPTPSANKLVGWNSAGTALENKTPADIDLATVTTFIETLLDDADGDALIATIVADQTAETSPASGDLISIVDVSLTPDDGRKMTLGNALKVVNDLSEDTSPSAVADFTLTYDADATAAKKVLLKNLHTKPTRTVLTSGTSATYNTPTGATYLNVRMVGGGAGGGAGASNAGSNGTDTVFGTLTAAKGSGGATSGGAGGSGGAGTNGDINITGGSGGNGANFSGSCMGGQGGASAFGGAPGANWQTSANTTGASAAANSGSGGAGGTSASNTAGAGGGAGGYAEKLISAPSSSYTYTVGAGGAGGTAGGGAGGNGAAGIIVVDEFYD